MHAAGPSSAIGSLSDSVARGPGFDTRFGPDSFVSSSADSRRAVVRYWGKYVHEVLCNRLGGLSLLRKSRSNMTSAVYCERKTTTQQQQLLNDCVYCSVTRICVLGTADGWFLKLTTKVHIDQVIEGFAQNCPYMSRLEIQWDPDTIRFSDKSNKFVDHIR